jgi:hypothetical protein
VEQPNQTGVLKIDNRTTTLVSTGVPNLSMTPWSNYVIIKNHFATPNKVTLHPGHKIFSFSYPYMAIPPLHSFGPLLPHSTFNLHFSLQISPKHIPFFLA